VSNLSFNLMLKKSFIYFYRYLHHCRVLPISRTFGAERGTPIGRYYIDLFLKKHSTAVKGRCLEFGGATYKSYFPHAGQYEVISIKEGPGIDYVGDVHNLSSLPVGIFDSIICTQVFEHLSHPHIAAKSLYSMMKPGGVLLFTVPFINNIHYSPTDFYRFTPYGCRLILEEVGFVINEIDYGGNSLVSVGSLLGLVAEDFSKEELSIKDPIYPYNNLIKAIKPE